MVWRSALLGPDFSSGVAQKSHIYNYTAWCPIEQVLKLNYAMRFLLTDVPWKQKG